MKTKKEISYWVLRGLFAITLLISIVIASCSNDDPTPNAGNDSNQNQSATVKGAVKDDNDNPYPNTMVTLSKGSEKLELFTNAEGNYEGKTKDVGSYEVSIVPPLGTDLVSANPASVNVKADQTSTVDFFIQPQSLEAHLNFGAVQLLEEIVDKDGNTPLDPNELLFAKNNFDEPLGQLNAIKAPDGHQITLSEFQTANGNFIVHCNGNTASIEISLEGMVPNGTYTFWLAYLKRKVKVGENIDFANDFVNFTNPPIGAANGTENIAIADANGNIGITLSHGTCILTDEAALVIPVLYHLNGKTFGGGHVPDAEEVVQLLVYFQ